MSEVACTDVRTRRGPDRASATKRSGKDSRPRGGAYEATVRSMEDTDLMVDHAELTRPHQPC